MYAEHRWSASRSAWLALRLSLGALFVAMGVGKLLDQAGFAAVIATYQLGLPAALLRPAALAVTGVELALGAWLISGRALRGAACLALILNTAYLALLLLTLARGIQLLNCGYFGVFLARPLSWYMPFEDLVLIAASAALLRKAHP